MTKLTITASGVFLFAMPLIGQQAEAPRQNGSPIYNVTVVDRSTEAINYQYRQGPTKIGFRGTVLLPQGKGEATVESKRGRTEIEAKFENLTTPSAYGREYLTYTLWAITPEGAARNLGEIVPGISNKADLRVTTDLQAFGLIVTAEPYSAARRPSDVVVLENEIRPDTLGSAQPINAKYELMPRGHYTWNVPDQMDANVASMPKVSMSKYEEILAIYEAQNALQIARSAGADTYAAGTFQKAEAEFANAQQLQANKTPSSKVIQMAKAAAETAEDARVIAENRGQEAQLAQAKAEVAQAQAATQQAQAATQKAIGEAQAARAEVEAEHAARELVEAEHAAEQPQTPSTVASAMPRDSRTLQPEPDAQKIELRRGLAAELGGLLPTRDTPRGLVVTLADPAFQGSELKSPSASQVYRLASIVAGHPGLRADVEGYSDDTSSGISAARAEAVRSVFERRGMPSSFVTARSFGDSRPLASNATAVGREQNRRVEIVISGDPIGSRASSDSTSSLVPGESRR